VCMLCRVPELAGGHRVQHVGAAAAGRHHVAPACRLVRHAQGEVLLARGISCTVECMVEVSELSDEGIFAKWFRLDFRENKKTNIVRNKRPCFAEFDDFKKFAQSSFPQLVFLGLFWSRFPQKFALNFFLETERKYPSFRFRYTRRQYGGVSSSLC
jgi:hypothetical protein